MTALRQEAIQMVNDMPENLIATLVEFMHKLQYETPVQNEPEPEIENPITEEEFQAFLHSGEGIDPKKAAALKGIEEWQERNRAFLNSGIDWDKELEEALNEKYGIIG